MQDNYYNTLNIINILLSNAILIPTLIIAWMAWNSNKASTKIYLDEIIQNALTNYRDTMKLSIEINFDSQDKVDKFNQLKAECLEDILNSYNRACAMYLQGAWIFTLIDRRLFLLERKSEIIGIVRDSDYKEIISPHYDTEFSSLIKVFSKIK